MKFEQKQGISKSKTFFNTSNKKKRALRYVKPRPCLRGAHEQPDFALRGGILGWFQVLTRYVGNMHSLVVKLTTSEPETVPRCRPAERKPAACALHIVVAAAARNQ